MVLFAFLFWKSIYLDIILLEALKILDERQDISNTEETFFCMVSNTYQCEKICISFEHKHKMSE